MIVFTIKLQIYFVTPGMRKNKVLSIVPDLVCVIHQFIWQFKKCTVLTFRSYTYKTTVLTLFLLPKKDCIFVQQTLNHMRQALIYFVLLFFFGFTSLYAQPEQKWTAVDQGHFGMKYELPENWEIDGFSSSSVCDCFGTINIGNRFSDEEVFMVVYPVKNKASLTDEKRTHVWGKHFQEQEEQTSHKIEKLVFVQTISHWITGAASGNIDTKTEVWRFITTWKKQHYVFYFWARKEVMAKNKATIFEILKRFKPVKAKLED